MNINDWSVEIVESCLERIAIPSAAKLQTKDYRAAGKYPVIDQGQAFIAGWTDDDAAVISAPLPLIIFGDHTRAFKFVDFPFVRGADGTQLLKPRAGIDPLFFYYACRAIDLPGRGYNRHFTILKNKEIQLAPRDVQHEIARVLRHVERGLEVQNQQVQGSETLERAGMRELFTRGLKGEAQKETEIGPVPESWELTPCGQIFKLTSGKTRPSDLTESQTEERPYPVLGGNGVMGFSREWHLDASRTLIIGRVGEYCGAIHTASGKIWITDNALYAKEWHDSNADLSFVATFLEYFDLNRFKRMAGQPLVTQGMINEHMIPLPQTIEEQLEITSIFSAIDRKIALHRKKRTVLHDLFTALLHKLMTGEIRVGDLDLPALNRKGDGVAPVCHPGVGLDRSVGGSVGPGLRRDNVVGAAANSAQ